jgi:predicted alpha-1,2-mannosidase
MKQILKTVLLFIFFSHQSHAQNNIQFVNLFIGTDGTGHTFPGPSMPFGMVQPGPDNNDKDWAYTSGYQYKDTVLLGFSQTRFSGTGIGEMGDILMLPFSETSNKSQQTSYRKSTERAEAGFYTLTKNDGVRVELTASERVAFHRYTFPDTNASLLINFQHGLKFLTDSLVLNSDVKIDDPRTISGYCHTKNWVKRKYFFVIQFDTPYASSKILPRERKENAPKYLFGFQLNKQKQLKIKIALSTVSTEGAKSNLTTEISHWDFEKVVQNAQNVWNDYLNRVEIDADRKRKEIFYTSMYHLLLQPSNIADVDGKYRGADDKIHQAKENQYYSTLSIWDIYRAAFPLLQILAPEKITPIVNSMLEHHKAAGFLPVWTAWGQDNYCMIGNHAIPMILSAYNNGFKGFDAREALQAMVETSTRSHINSDWELYNQYGYYPFDKLDNEAVSRTLESSFDDWCVAQMAKNIHDTNVFRVFSQRAIYYRNLFDPETRLFRGKNTQGEWRTPFDPFTATSPMNNPGDYTEANAWQYFWTPAQYDIEGVMNLLGGKAEFTKHLNTFFTTEARNPDKFLGQEAMIGQYAHGNEPSHHIAWLYAFSDSPKTGQKYIHQIVNQFHNNTPDGMIGNDDCGQMSAWYIFSCLGFYPVNASTGEFVIGAPRLRKATIHLQSGKQLTIEATDFSDERIFVKSVTWDDQELSGPFVSFSDICRGGTLQFEMTGQFDDQIEELN